MSNVFETYLQHVEERAADGLPPLPLNVEQITAVCEALTNGDSVAGIDLIDLLTNRVSPGVDPAAKVKAEFLQKVAEGSVTVSDLTVGRSIELLGTMVGGFNVPVLVDLLSNEAITSGDDAGTLLSLIHI